MLLKVTVVSIPSRGKTPGELGGTVTQRPSKRSWDRRFLYRESTLSLGRYIRPHESESSLLDSSGSLALIETPPLIHLKVLFFSGTLFYATFRDHSAPSTGELSLKSVINSIQSGGVENEQRGLDGTLLLWTLSTLRLGVITHHLLTCEPDPDRRGGTLRLWSQ